MGLLLVGCADQTGSRPFGTTPYNIGQVLEANENFFHIVTDKSVYGDYTSTNYDGTLSIPQKEAIKHCAKYKKYAHYFKWDFNNKGSYYRCYATKTYKNNEGKELDWSSYPKEPWVVVSKKTEPKKKKPKKKKPKQSPDDNKVVAASSGSGFFVTRAGHLATNHHVIEECDAVKVNFNGKEIQADTIAIDQFNDLAIIKANINPSKVFPVSKEDVSLLQEVIVAGFPLGKKISALIKTHKGNVSALAGIGDNYSNFQTDATINHGNSGGPILTQKGNVIGVAVQLIPPDKAQNVFFGVKSSTLNTFAKANKVNFLPPNTQEMSNEDLGQLITEATVFLECWMTVAKIKQLIAQEENRKAFYSKFK